MAYTAPSAAVSLARSFHVAVLHNLMTPSRVPTASSEPSAEKARVVTGRPCGSAVSSSPLALGSWSHVTCTWSPTGLSVYVDGFLEGADLGVEGVLHANAAPHTFGAREKEGSLSQRFEGVLDEVYVYDRTPSESEVVDVAFGASDPPPERSNGSPRTPWRSSECRPSWRSQA